MPVKEQIHQIRDARQRFNDEIEALRPDLHRFCARMTGSVTEGEDVVQDTLVHAFYRLPDLRDETKLRGWLFGIAHHRCIDFLRRRKLLLPLDEQLSSSNDEHAEFEHRRLAEQTLTVIFTRLPPKERASIILKDVLGYSLEEAAEITASNVGAVKAALHRAREKLAAPPSAPTPTLSVAHRELVERYIDRFNRRDWDGVRALLREDARLEVVQRSEGPFAGTYFTNYGRLSWEWRLELAVVEGLPTVVHSRRTPAGWQPHSVIAFELDGDRIALVRDYVHIEYLLLGAHIVSE